MSLDPVSAVLDIGGKLIEPGYNYRMKTCIQCQNERPETDFRVRRESGRLRAECRRCAGVNEKARYNRRRVDILEYEQRKAEADPVGKLLRSAQSTAKRKGLEFNLTRKDIIIPAVCPYLLVPITNIRRTGFVWTNASIDRVDSSLGYITGNIQVISRKANSMKNDATAAEMVTFAQQVLKIHGAHHGA